MPLHSNSDTGSSPGDSSGVRALATAAGFTVAVDTRQNTGAAANVVVDQNPKTTAVPGGTITLIISAGR